MTSDPFPFVKCAVRHCELDTLAEDNKFCVEHWDVMCDNPKGDFVKCSLLGCESHAVRKGRDYCGEHWGDLQSWLARNEKDEKAPTVKVLDEPVRNERNEMADYYFYRCKKCTGLITRLQMKAALEQGNLCPCGGGMIGPSNPFGLEWLKPSVLWMTLLKLLGQLEDAPAPTLPLPVPVGVRSVPALKDEEKWDS